MIWPIGYSIYRLISVIYVITHVSGQQSPCPDIFKYYQDNQGYYGILTIPARGPGKTFVNVTIGAPGKINYMEPKGLKLLKPLVETVTNAQLGIDIKYRLDFPKSDMWPILQSITVNDKIICTGMQVNINIAWSFQHKLSYPEDAAHLSSPLDQLGTRMNFENTPFPRDVFPNNLYLNGQYTTSTYNKNRLFVTTPGYLFPVTPKQLPRPYLIQQDQTVPENAPFSLNIFPTNPFLNGEYNNIGTQDSSTKRNITRKPNLPLMDFEHPNPPANNIRPAIPDDGSWLSTYKYNHICGRHDFQETTQTIIGGEDTIAGEFPWMVAIFHLNQQQNSIYACGGSLISDKHILTTAKCTNNQEQVQLEIGRFHLNDRNEQYETRLSQEIFQHPEYRPKTAHADISIITVPQVKFSARINPVCLWAFGTDLDNILNRGYITGWGQKESRGNRSNIPIKLRIKTTTLDICQKSHEMFKNIATDKTFCAGGNDAGPCHGDSGSGYYIKNRRKWYLRGMISTTIGNSTLCNVNQYSVYADVSFFLNWIRSVIM